jgi:hypothetical protein
MMRGEKIDWQRHDALKAKGMSRRERARQLSIAETTLREAEKEREQKAQGTLSVPMRVPQEKQVLSTAIPSATRSDLHQLLAQYDTSIKAYVEQRIQEAIERQRPVELPPQRLQLPMGTPVPKYPDKPYKDVRLNLHVSAATLWEVHIVAAAFGESPSRLMREVWRLFRESPQAKQVLEQALNSQGGEASFEGTLEEDA